MCDHCGCRRYPAIAELTAEHEEILALAWRLAEADGTDPAADQIRRDLLSDLDPHVTKEEQALYPLLHDQGELPPERAAALEAEHVQLRRAITGGCFGRRDFYALAAHIEEEEAELFPAAMFSFDDAEWDAAEAVHRQAGSGLPSPAPAATRSRPLPRASHRSLANLTR